MVVILCAAGALIASRRLRVESTSAAPHLHVAVPRRHSLFAVAAPRCRVVVVLEICTAMRVRVCMCWCTCMLHTIANKGVARILHWGQDRSPRARVGLLGGGSIAAAETPSPPTRESGDRSPAGFGAEPRPPNGFPLFQHSGWPLLTL